MRVDESENERRSGERGRLDENELSLNDAENLVRGRTSLVAADARPRSESLVRQGAEGKKLCQGTEKRLLSLVESSENRLEGRSEEVEGIVQRIV